MYSRKRQRTALLSFNHMIHPIHVLNPLGQLEIGGGVVTPGTEYRWSQTALMERDDGDAAGLHRREIDNSFSCINVKLNR
jgi:hypothetical protein